MGTQRIATSGNARVKILFNILLIPCDFGTESGIPISEKSRYSQATYEPGLEPVKQIKEVKQLAEGWNNWKKLGIFFKLFQFPL